MRIKIFSLFFGRFALFFARGTKSEEKPILLLNVSEETNLWNKYALAGARNARFALSFEEYQESLREVEEAKRNLVTYLKDIEIGRSLDCACL